MKLTGQFNIGSRTRWLLSETLVVVLGVLIALGINNYWIDREERALELQYLKRIHEDVSTDAEVIDQWFGDGLQKKLRALDAIAPIVRGVEPVPENVGLFSSGGRKSSVTAASLNANLRRLFRCKLTAVGCRGSHHV